LAQPERNEGSSPPETSGHSQTRAQPQPQPQSQSQPQSQPQSFLDLYRQRVEAENAAARDALKPLEPGERPWPITAGVALTTLAGVGNLIAYAAGAKIGGKHPAPGGIFLFSAVMLFCAYGMWRLWYSAVLVFMIVLAIVVVLFSLFLIEASNLLGLLVPPIFIFGGGFLFWKLVRVAARIQKPAPPAP
jgi:hypothetical protein